MAEREEKARANVRAALQDAGVGWASEVTLTGDGYTLTLRSGERTFTQRNLDPAVLEDDSSPVLDGLLEQARRHFAAGPQG